VQTVAASRPGGAPRARTHALQRSDAGSVADHPRARLR
jgi:hypothetical protein